MSYLCCCLTFVAVHKGSTWRRTAWIEGLNECNVLETVSGDVHLDSRNQRGPVTDFPANFSNCRCRLGANSHDGGDSFSSVEMVPALPDIVCQGCMVRDQVSGLKHDYSIKEDMAPTTRYLFAGPNGNAPSCQSCNGSSACCNETMRRPCQYGSRCYESVWQSADGVEWSGPHVVDAGPTGYSSVMPLVEAASDAVGVLYERYADGCAGASCRVSFS